MMKSNLFDFVQCMRQMEDYEYLLSLLAHHCGPTIERVKVSSLLNIRNSKNRLLSEVWENRKGELLQFFGVSSFSLKKDDSGEIVLIYHEDLLKEQLCKKEHIEFLSRFGYQNDWDYLQYLEFLKKRYTNLCPHEIGVFLGYPIYDVMQFISCPNKECRFVGYWKVYENEEVAKEIFRSYDEAKQISCLKTVEKIFPESALKRKIYKSLMNSTLS